MKNFCKITQLLLTIAALVLTATMITDYSRYQQWALCATGGLYVLDYLLNLRWREFQWKRTSWVMVAMIGFFLLTIIRNGLDRFEMTRLFSHQIELLAPFFVLALIGILGVDHALTKRQIAYTTILTSLAVIIATFVLCAVKAPLPDYILYSTPLEYYHAQMHQYIGTHMSLDLYMNIALIFGLMMAIQSGNKKEKVFFWISSSIVAVSTCLSDGRSGMLATLLIIGIVAICEGWKRWGYKALVGLVLCLGLAGGFIALNGRFHLPSQLTDESSAQADPRLCLWKYTYGWIEERPILGHGYGIEDAYIAGAFADKDVKTHYIDMMAATGLLTFDTMVEVHPHNTFLLLWLEAGIFAPLALILIFVLACLLTKKEDRLYVILFSLVILWQAMFDSFCSVFQPTVVCWFLLLWLCTNREQKHIV